MDSNLQLFNYNGNEIRTVQKDGETWWVLKDVCDVLGIANITQLAQRLDDDERSMFNIGRQGETNIINESGLYNVILRSDKPEAKDFKRWVTHEVLPAIRKTGGYIPVTLEDTESEIMAKAFLIANKTIEDQKQKIGQLEVSNSQLTVSNQIMQPKADYFDELVDRNLLTNFRNTAKELGINEQNFIEFLLSNRYIYRENKILMPYAAKNNGLFEVKECCNNKTQWRGLQTLITPKGREHFRLLCQHLKKNNKSS